MSRHSYRPRSNAEVSKPRTPANFRRTFGVLFRPCFSSSANSASTRGSSRRSIHRHAIYFANPFTFDCSLTHLPLFRRTTINDREVNCSPNYIVVWHLLATSLSLLVPSSVPPFVHRGRKPSLPCAIALPQTGAELPCVGLAPAGADQAIGRPTDQGSAAVAPQLVVLLPWPRVSAELQWTMVMEATGVLHVLFKGRRRDIYNFATGL